MLEPLKYNPPKGQISIIHKDEEILLIDKPSGLLSVPGKSPEHYDCMEMRVKAAFPETLLVHRLDMDTSGVMIFAMNKVAQRHLGLQFERRHMEKSYIAIVEGPVAKDEGLVDLPMIVDWPNRPLQKICYDTGKAATTKWRVIRRDADKTRLRLFPETGRSHQLRVHMKEIGHPILGDRFYGDPASAGRLQLHAESLTLFHPQGGGRVRFEADCPF